MARSTAELFRPAALCGRRISDEGRDPAPLTPRQLRVLLAATAGELLWAEPIAVRELRAWRKRAAAISDTRIRRDALSAIDHKRTNTHGAALFWMLARPRNHTLLRLLIAYQVMWDFLDTLSERTAHLGLANGLLLHRALTDVFDPSPTESDYFRHDRSGGDDGYLRALVEAGRRHLGELPSLHLARPALAVHARRASVQVIGHIPDVCEREALLRDWVDRELGDEGELEWFELAAGASADITTFALMALAARADCTHADIEADERVYGLASTIATMLDSYADRSEDARHGDHSFIAYYPDGGLAEQRLRQLIGRVMNEAEALDHTEEHRVLIACMIAMYLSKDAARRAPTRATTCSLLAAGGSLTRALVPCLRLWRTVYGQRSD
jgi:tetraprenyl-beta-curcumene synthase